MDRLSRDGVIDDRNVHKYSSSRAYVWDLVRMVVGCDICVFESKKYFLDDDRILRIKSLLKGYYYNINRRVGLEDRLYDLFSKFLTCPKVSTMLRYRYILKDDGDVEEDRRYEWLLSKDSRTFIKYYVTLKLFSKLSLTQTISLINNWDKDGTQYTCILVDEQFDDVLITSILKQILRYKILSCNPIKKLDNFLLGGIIPTYYEYMDSHMSEIKYTSEDGINNFYNLIRQYENHVNDNNLQEVLNE